MVPDTAVKLMGCCAATWLFFSTSGKLGEQQYYALALLTTVFRDQPRWEKTPTRSEERATGLDQYVANIRIKPQQKELVEMHRQL